MPDRAKVAATVTVTHNEIIQALNRPDDFMLAFVVVDEPAGPPRYIRGPFHNEPDFAAASVNFNLSKLLPNSLVRC